METPRYSNSSSSSIRKEEHAPAAGGKGDVAAPIGLRDRVVLDGSCPPLACYGRFDFRVEGLGCRVGAGLGVEGV